MLIDAQADVVIPIVFTDPATGEAANPDALPTFRILGVDSSAQGGTAAYLEDGTIASIAVGATTTINTDADHGLLTGAVVTIAGAAGTTNVNGTHLITVVDANTFTFDDVTSSGVYTSGASWKSTGIFGCTLDSSIRDAMETGRNYLLVATGVFSGDPRVETVRLTVVA